MPSVPAVGLQAFFPKSPSTLSYWRANLHHLDDHRSTAELPAACEILIIGAGYAGAATAYHLFKDDPSPPSAVILEARQACSGATGRNGGHLRPEVYFNMLAYMASYGVHAAAEISKFETAHIQAFKELIEKENIDCGFTLTRTFDVFLDEEQAQRSKTAYDQLVTMGLEGLNDVHYTGAKNAEAVCGVKGAKACFSFTAAHLWPYKFIMWLLERVVNAGLNLQTHTPVTHVGAEADSDGCYAVHTPRGLMKARKIVFACNGYTAGVLPQYANVIVPCRSICSSVKSSGKGRSLPHLSNGSIIVGGARSAFLDDPDVWYGAADDSQMIEPAANYFDGYMQRMFRGWEDSGAMTDKVWTGITAATPDLLPHIGRIPSKSNQFILAGFNGHGMPVILLAAKGVAQMIRDDNVLFEQTGIPAVFQTTEQRLKGAQFD